MMDYLALLSSDYNLTEAHTGAIPMSDDAPYGLEQNGVRRQLSRATRLYVLDECPVGLNELRRLSERMRVMPRQAKLA